MMAKRKQNSDPELFTRIDDALYGEVAQLAGQRIVHVEIWEDSLADDLQEANEGAVTLFDVDLYLEAGVFFELYGVAAFPGLDDEPLADEDALTHRLLTLVNRHVWLEDTAVDEDDNLVLVLGRQRTACLYLAVGAWALDEWEELPSV